MHAWLPVWVGRLCHNGMFAEPYLLSISISSPLYGCVFARFSTLCVVCFLSCCMDTYISSSMLRVRVAPMGHILPECPAEYWSECSLFQKTAGQYCYEYG